MRSVLRGRCGWVILGMMMLTAPVAFAQSAPILLIPADSRTLSMGGVALRPDVEAVEARVQSAAWAPRSAGNSLVGVDVFYCADKRVWISLEGRLLLDRPYDATSPQGQVTGSFRPYDWTAAVGATFSLSDAFALGIKARAVTSELAEDVRGTAYCGDFFFSYTDGRVSASLGVRNLGSQIKYGGKGYPLPALIALQGSVRPLDGLTVAAEADYLFRGALMVGLGVEYTFAKILSVRGGYHYGDADKAIPSYASLGLGVQYAGFHVDAAYLLASQTLGNTLMIGLGYAF